MNLLIWFLKLLKRLRRVKVTRKEMAIESSKFTIEDTLHTRLLPLLSYDYEKVIKYLEEVIEELRVK